MSRIGKAIIEIPKDVTVKVAANDLTVKGPKGSLSFVLKPSIKVTIDGQKAVLVRDSNDKLTKSLHGLSRSILANMIKGVSLGYEKDLEITGVGYRVAKEGKKLILSMGYSHPIEIVPPEGIEFIVTGQTKIKVVGADKQMVGQIASNIKFVRPVEPYKGKGIKYLGQYVRRKAGKAAAKAA